MQLRRPRIVAQSGLLVLAVAAASTACSSESTKVAADGAAGAQGPQGGTTGPQGGTSATGSSGTSSGGSAGSTASGGSTTSHPATSSSSLPRDAGASCPVQTAGPFGVRFARSAGYEGTLSDYDPLYKVSCTNLDACATSCAAAGGSKDSCTSGSECVDGPDGKHCLPPTYWYYGDKAQVADDDPVTLVLVHNPYRDPLILRDFGIQIPADASIRGIQFDVLRSALDEKEAMDDAVRVLRNGQPVGDDKKLKDVTWPTSLTYASYGGPSDTWGVSWTAAEVTSPQFGLSFAPLYTDTAGNTRAYVDYARVWISYAPAHCP